MHYQYGILGFTTRHDCAVWCCVLCRNPPRARASVWWRVLALDGTMLERLEGGAHSHRRASADSWRHSRAIQDRHNAQATRLETTTRWLPLIATQFVSWSPSTFDERHVTNDPQTASTDQADCIHCIQYWCTYISLLCILQLMFFLTFILFFCRF